MNTFVIVRDVTVVEFGPFVLVLEETRLVAFEGV